MSDIGSIDHEQPSRHKQAEIALPVTETAKNSACLTGKPGQPCPACGNGLMDYDSLLVLCCPVCGFKEPGGGFT
ncbi:MAG TPA: hypothetical protein PK883_10850 [Anaerolineaceae bacterium]|nr:hypothetical protein [Anaerolineaceae bacterium]